MIMRTTISTTLDSFFLLRRRGTGLSEFDQMLRHIREDKCEQCKKMVVYLDRELAIELYLHNTRN